MFLNFDKKVTGANFEESTQEFYPALYHLGLLDITNIRFKKVIRATKNIFFYY